MRTASSKAVGLTKLVESGEMHNGFELFFPVKVIERFHLEDLPFKDQIRGVGAITQPREFLGDQFGEDEIKDLHRNFEWDYFKENVH